MCLQNDELLRWPVIWLGPFIPFPPTLLFHWRWVGWRSPVLWAWPPFDICNPHTNSSVFQYRRHTEHSKCAPPPQICFANEICLSRSTIELLSDWVRVVQFDRESTHPSSFLAGVPNASSYCNNIQACTWSFILRSFAIRLQHSAYPFEV